VLGDSVKAFLYILPAFLDRAAGSARQGNVLLMRPEFLQSCRIALMELLLGRIELGEKRVELFCTGGSLLLSGRTNGETSDRHDSTNSRN